MSTWIVCSGLNHGQNHSGRRPGTVQHLLRCDQGASAIGTLRCVRITVVEREVASGDLHSKLVAAIDSRGGMSKVHLNAIFFSALEWRRIQFRIPKASTLDPHCQV